MKTIFSLTIFSLFVLSICMSENENILKTFENHHPLEVFKAFHSFYQRKYDINSDIGRKKYKVFLQNLIEIKNVNSRNLKYKYGITPFVDLTKEEFIKEVLVNPASLKSQMNDFLKESDSGIKVKNTRQVKANNIDWTTTFLEPRNQLQCGSCWAFATSGVVEANWWKDNQGEEKFYVSPQQLVDCDTENHGCNGGWYNAALDYTKNEGLIQDDLYPYQGKEGQCEVPSEGKRITIEKYLFCNDCSFDDWYNLLSTGPIAVAVDATQFQFYESGVINLEDCGDLNHAVIAVGWESSGDGDVISIRNSWGTNWGEQGYIRVLYQEEGHTCSITNYAYLPESKLKSVKKENPKTDCFTIKNNNIPKGLKLENKANSTISFKGKGNGIEIKAFTLSWSPVLDIEIAGWHNSTTKVLRNSDTKCEWKFILDTDSTYNYKVVYSSEEVSLFVNDLKFTCPNINKLNIPLYIVFGGREDANICELKINN